MIRFGDKNFTILEDRFDGLSMNFIRIRGSYFSFGKFLRLIEHHVAHIDVVIGIAAFAQNRFSNIKNLIQLEFNISFINPQTSHENLLIPV